jgi:hypothetical protein
VRELAEKSEHGKFLIAAESGHYITFDRPDIVIEELAGMIETIRMQPHTNLAPVQVQ